MRRFFIVACVIATVFCGAAVFLGLCSALKAATVASYVFSAVGALVVLALMVSTSDIWRKPDPVHRSIRPFWGVAVFVTIATVGLACCNHVILDNPVTRSPAIDWAKVLESDWMQRATVAVFVLFLSGAPIVMSHFWGKFYEDEDEPVIRPRKPAAEAPKAAVPASSGPTHPPSL